VETVRGTLSWTLALETCAAELVASTPLCGDPEPANPCLDGACSAGECVPVQVDVPCDDGDACTLGDACGDGACQPGPPRDCSDPCLSEATCVAGECSGTAVTCDDGIACTVDQCVPAVGCAYVPTNALCAPTDACHASTCDPLLDCVVSPLTGPACDDGDPCTVDDRCTEGGCAGQPMVCPSDGVECTEERCVAGTCTSFPLDRRCVSDDCTVGECRPGDRTANARGCVTVPVGEGEACTDDGLSCTDDVCTGGGCLHVPIDSRCGPAGECSRAVCVPEDAAHDAAGCVLDPTDDPVPDGADSGPGGGEGDGGVDDRGPGGSSTGNGRKGKGGKGGKGKRHGGTVVARALETTAPGCAEDGDPCSNDLCRDGLCVHEAVPAPETCAPVQGAFRKSLGLAALTRALVVDVETGRRPEASTERGVLGALMERLARVESDLGASADALAGRSGGATASTVSPRAAAATIPETPAQERARIAFTMVLRTPRQVSGFLQLVAEARARAQIGRPAARGLRRRGRLLLRGTKNLKGELRRLQRVSMSFAR
jgi:hypothetical protein